MYETEFKMTAEGAAAALTKMAEDFATPPDYDLHNHNCVNWVQDVGDAAGVQIPKGDGSYDVDHPVIGGHHKAELQAAGMLAKSLRELKESRSKEATRDGK